MAGNTTIWLNQQKETIDTLVNLSDIRSMQDAEQKPLLVTFMQQHANIYLVHTIGRNGMNVARSDDGELTDYQDRAYFKSVMSGSPVAFKSQIGRTSRLHRCTDSGIVRYCWGRHNVWRINGNCPERAKRQGRKHRFFICCG
jgi:hypothetical protein